ncbi:MAG: glycosyltransferase, partial [Ruminococcus sp.]|nr:glycosyltransferase [Ruminococcus sp.]
AVTAVFAETDEEIPTVSFVNTYEESTGSLKITKELAGNETTTQKFKYLPLRLVSTVISKVFEKCHKKVPADIAKMSLQWQYHREIAYFKNKLIQNPDLTVITFLQPTIPIVLLAARGLPNKIIISERCDPHRLMKKRYGQAFIEKYYKRANVVVFQTDDAKNVYPKCISKKGIVIPNPIKANLPDAYTGERNNYITTFCRISLQKNLPLLVNAFERLHNDYPEYVLRIIGDAPNSEDKQALSDLKDLIDKLDLNDAVKFEPFKANVHEYIKKDAMYVNSSDYEGISNAMLEALAIGMPSVCTDCPIGGAKATINDGENGLLVPINDVDALYKAMKQICDDKVLASKLSENAAKLRYELSLDKIAKRWEELV